MKNVTISMDEELHNVVRVDAAKAGLSVSRYIAQVLKSAALSRSEDDARLRRNEQLEALDRILSGPKWDVSENGRMPNAEERNARR
ncbi:MAG: hypothetical protein Q8Q62_21350 [Mesorhizobium sp.]|nr:hypothetical protein [Mesorhizobium sp.]